MLAWVKKLQGHDEYDDDVNGNHYDRYGDENDVIDS